MRPDDTKVLNDRDRYNNKHKGLPMSDDKRQDDDELELAPDTGDEDLMSDFKDLFPEDEEPVAGETGQETGSGTSEALDELDAFLDDFEQGMDASGGATEETAASEDEPDTGQLREDELDLAVSDADADTAFGDDWGAGEQESEEVSGEPETEEFDIFSAPQTPGTEDSQADAEESIAMAAATGGTADMNASPAPVETAAAPGRAATYAIVGAVVAALGLSAASLWFGYSAGGQVDELEQQLSSLSQSPRRTPPPPPATGNAQLQAELRQLAARVNDLAVIIEGPISHLRQSNEETLGALSERLDALEQKMNAGAPVRSAASKPVDKRPAAQSTPTSTGTAVKSGGWVINLISLRSEKDAQEEMQRLRKAGVRVEMQRAVADGKTWYRLQVPGFASYAGAKAYIDTVQKQAGVKDAWVAKD